jgi:hypothetical protein
VTPTVAGTYPTNVRATGEYDSSETTRQTVTFPVPTITVLEPEPPVCSLPQSWTVMVHSFPDATGVSSAERPGCNNNFDSGDWFGGTRMDLPNLSYELLDGDDGTLLFEGTSAPNAGRVDQWLYIRVCEPPPYVLSLVTTDLASYHPCHNSPLTRTITRRNFRPEAFHRTLERYGFVR